MVDVAKTYAEHKTARINRLNPVLNLVCQKLFLVAVWRGNTVALTGCSSSSGSEKSCSLTLYKQGFGKFDRI